MSATLCSIITSVVCHFDSFLLGPTEVFARDIYSGHFPPAPPRVVRKFLSKVKNREKFEGGLHEKRKGKGGGKRKNKRVIKHMLKYLYEA